MTRNEIKKLLRARESLADSYKELILDSEIITLEDANNVYEKSRINIGEVINLIDAELLKYVKENPVGIWLLKIKGMNPYIAAGLITYFSVKGKDCAAQFIRYAGSDNINNPHCRAVRKIIDKFEKNFKLENEDESLYKKLNKDEFFRILNKNEYDGEFVDIRTAHIKADRYTRKIFLSHLFEEMYREEHNGALPARYNDDERIIIEPEVPYTK